ncbi:DUF3221 domain-containing protein [Paenibacillus sp. USHLN196]|uniref:DUF3221 domain-containing protein n=1 Tax=Paenibacillus sp. USHLN196 TaxID=3081291 RepID=UPI00301AEAE8
MKFMKVLLICSLLFILSACTIFNSNDQQVQGYVKEIDQSNKRILVISDLVPEDLQEDTNKLIQSNKYSEVYWVSGINLSKFNVGDEIEITYDTLETSYPGILTAKKYTKLANE